MTAPLPDLPVVSPRLGPDAAIGRSRGDGRGLESLDHEVDAERPSQTNTLLAILLIRAGEVVSADRPIDELWGSDLPANPANALQVVVSRLRRALERELYHPAQVTSSVGRDLELEEVKKALESHAW